MPCISTCKEESFTHASIVHVGGSLNGVEFNLEGKHLYSMDILQCSR